MKIILSKILGAALITATLASTFIHAQTVTTAPVGFVRYNALANTDIFVTPPFERPAFWSGTIASVSGNVVTLNNAAMTANQLVYVSGTQPNTYYLKIGNHPNTNPKEGNYYTITANGTNTVTLDLAGDNISAIAPGTKAKIIPYWTLNTLFPNGQGVVGSTSQFNIQTRILIADTTSTGINLSSSATMYYLSSANQWRQLGSSDNKNDYVIFPDVPFTVRGPATATQFAIAGNVSLDKFSTWLSTNNTVEQDNTIGLPRPMPVQLGQLGFVDANFVPSPSPLSVKDRLLVFDNTTTGINKSAPKTYYRLTNGQWRLLGGGNYNASTDLVNPSQKLVVRKKPVPGGPSVVVTNAPNYPTN